MSVPARQTQDLKVPTFVCHCPLEAISNAIVFPVESALFQHLILVLDEELDTLDRGGGSLRDGGRDTTHWENVRRVKD